MTYFHSLKLRLRAWLGLAMVAAAIYAVSGPLAIGADSSSSSPTNSAASQQKKAKKKLTGAELYAINCNRCHPERYPTEFTPSQWKTLVTHMRVRANLPAAQAREILKYLQEESGN